MDDLDAVGSLPALQPGRSRDIRFVVAWTLVSAVGFAVLGVLFHNFPIAYRMPPVFRYHGHFDLQAAVFGGVAFGALPTLLVGIAQRLVMRRRLAMTWRWILTPALGVGSLHFAFDGFPDARDMTLAVVISGAAMGLYQWRLLRAPAAVSSAWVLLTVVAWYGGWVVGMELLDAVGLVGGHWTPSLGAKQHGVLGASMGLAYGLLTGTVLAMKVPGRGLTAMQQAIADHMRRF